jgi:hypothetical protein
MPVKKSNGELPVSGGEYKLSEGNFETIPNDTTAFAMVESAVFAKYKDTGLEYIKITWNLMEPEELANRKVWQSLWVKDLDPNTATEKQVAKKDKHTDMMYAIDGNASGVAFKLDRLPTNEELQSWVDHPMFIKIMAMNLKDGSQLNWISWVIPKNKEGVKAEIGKTKAQAAKVEKKNPQGDGLPF